MPFDIEPIIISLTIWKNIVIMYMHNTDIIIISSTRNKLIKIYIYIITRRNVDLDGAMIESMAIICWMRVFIKDHAR